MSKKLPIVHCRCCRGEIDRNTQVENVDWVLRAKGWYYHKKCLEDWVATKDDIHIKRNDNEWMNFAWEYLRRDLKISMEYVKFQAQWNSFLKKGMTSKGIYFSLKYFYDIQEGDKEKSQGGIGIVPYIYKDGCQYWVDRENKEVGIIAKIEEQIRLRSTQEKVEIKVPKQKKEKKMKYSLDDIASMEDTNGID